MKRLLALIIVLTPITSQAFDLPWNKKARIEQCKDLVRERSTAAGTIHTLDFYDGTSFELDAGYKVFVGGTDSAASYRIFCYFDKNGNMVDYNWNVG